MTTRTKIKKYFVERDRRGRIKNWVRIKRAMPIDKSKRARTIVKSGHGHQGDLARNMAFNY